MVTDPRLRLVAGTELAEHGATVLAALDRIRVVLRLNNAPPATAPAVGLLIGLVARLFAHVAIDGDVTATVSGSSFSATDLLDRLAWLRPSAVAEPTVDRVISIGWPADHSVDLGIGGGAWTARLGRGAPQPVIVEPDGALLGVQVAVCLAVGELVKDVLAPIGFISRRLDHDFVWDLLTYRVGKPADVPDQLEHRPIAVAVAGVGSVGTSLVCALLGAGRPSVLRVELVDPELFDDRNPFRYPALVDNVLGIGKARWARDLLLAAGVKAEAHRCDIGRWVSTTVQPGFDGVLVASPDTIDGRRDVADVLARTTVSVGVGGLAFHVSRHHSGDGLACPYCEYVDTGPVSTQAEVYAANTGLGVARILQLMQPGAVLTAADAHTAMAAGKISGGTATALVGHRLDDLIARTYAEAAVGAPTGRGGDAGPVFLAAPYVSALAGTLAAVEISKISLGLPGVDRRLDLDLAGLPQGYLRRPAADPTGHCLCASPVRQDAAEQLYHPTLVAGRVDIRRGEGH